MGELTGPHVTATGRLTVRTRENARIGGCEGSPMSPTPPLVAQRLRAPESASASGEAAKRGHSLAEHGSAPTPHPPTASPQPHLRRHHIPRPTARGGADARSAGRHAGDHRRDRTGQPRRPASGVNIMGELMANSPRSCCFDASFLGEIVSHEPSDRRAHGFGAGPLQPPLMAPASGPLPFCVRA